ncbi:transcriptional regulator, LysR family [Cohaesibacter sp. ES.047]|uniref:LysR substrate-binding domain-containing protein n=1 Tax=Cohaesibacter sp. ES.047 TaxID=1798205 RepID=UPI000BB87D29|nr:LysR substrate-binding domain-containing protein [Cohaesibacter sp. ES.047]SNY93567.1 transcriptional regulator, LysR family [Cohaesibacter sp. ES.047]
MTSILRLRQLEALLAVANHGSMTVAASELGISQPAVSRLLSDLAKEVGFAVYDRKDGQIVPTQEACFLLPSIRQVLELMQRIADVSHEITKRRAGHIRVACLPGFATSHLPDVVATFLKERPGVSMTIEPDRPERILEWMIGEQYDFGITDGFAGHPSLESSSVEIRTVCVFPRGHRLAGRDVVAPADLLEEKIIHSRRDSEFFGRLSSAFQDAHVALNSHIEVRQFTAACELVCRGAGVSVVSELDAVQFRERGLDFRPFLPRTPHVLSLVRPLLSRPSMITAEFMTSFLKSLNPYLECYPDTGL